MSSTGFKLQADSECQQLEHRWQERQPSDHPVPLRLIDDALVPFTALTRDVSSTGLGLVSKRLFEVGTRLGVQVQDGLFMALIARVVHVQPMGDGRFLLGCSLSRALTVREVDVLLGNGRKSFSQPTGEV
jgi:hypothetical protein